MLEELLVEVFDSDLCSKIGGKPVGKRALTSPALSSHQELGAEFVHPKRNLQFGVIYCQVVGT